MLLSTLPILYTKRSKNNCLFEGSRRSGDDHPKVMLHTSPSAQLLTWICGVANTVQMIHLLSSPLCIACFRPHSSSFEHQLPKLEHIPKLEPIQPPGTPPTPPGVNCEESLGVAVCAGCGRRIADRFYLQAVDRRWHAACLQCCQCRNTLDGEVTCFARDGNIYCKKDYYR